MMLQCHVASSQYLNVCKSVQKEVLQHQTYQKLTPNTISSSPQLAQIHTEHCVCITESILLHPPFPHWCMQHCNSTRWICIVAMRIYIVPSVSAIDVCHSSRKCEGCVKHVSYAGATQSSACKNKTYCRLSTFPLSQKPRRSLSRNSRICFKYVKVSKPLSRFALVDWETEQ